MVDRVRVRDPLKLLSKEQVADLIGVHPSTVMRWCRDGLLPAPVEVTQQTIRWRETDISNWVDQMEREGRTLDVA